MSTAVIGATGRVGSQVVGGLLARGDAVAALVRDPGKARRAFGSPAIPAPVTELTARLVSGGCPVMAGARGRR